MPPRATQKRHARMRRQRSRRSRLPHSHKKKGGGGEQQSGDGSATYYGLPWNRQSCWMDTSLMALFYPNSVHSVIYPYVERTSHRKDMADIMPSLTQTIAELRTPGVTPTLHGLRSLFAKHFASKRSAPHDQQDAFQVENELGYVFYFVQELLHVMGVPPIFMRHRADGRSRKQWILEIEQCDERTPLQKCLRQNYADWRIPRRSMDYLFIELVGGGVKPQQHIHFNGRSWTLASMIVFDCSHFISYLKQDGQWYLYDDTRSLSHIGLQPYSFGQVYRKGGCRFKYGKENTFFFYVPRQRRCGGEKR